MNKIKKFLLMLAVLIISITGICLTATACFGGETSTLAISTQRLSLNVNGNNGVLRATVTPANSDARYEWSVADPTVVSINSRTSTCTVTPLKEGTTTVSVTALGQTATCNVTVGPDQHVKLNAPSFTYDETTGIITITDTNEADRVSGYRLDFFNAANEVVGELEVVSGDEVKTHKLDKGTYTAKLVALGSQELYTTSDYSETSITIEVTKDKMVELSGSGDDSALASENGWAYYKYDWVIVSEAYYYDNAATLVFSNNTADSTEYSWILQLIYHNETVETGKTYQMTINIHSTAEGRLSLAGKAVTVHEGDNVINVGFAADETNKGLFKIQFGIWGEYNSLKEGTVSVSIVEELKELTSVKVLQVPDSFTYNTDNKIVDIVDTKNNPYDLKYMLGFFSDESSSEVLGTAVVEDGEELNVEKVLSGTYFVRIMAATTGLPYESSVWSTYGQTITVQNEKVNILNGNQSGAWNTPNTWYEWHATTAQSQPAEIVVEEAYINLEGNVFVSFYAQSGTSNQPLKLFYRDSSMEVGDIYRLTFTLQSPMAGYITVNGTQIAVVEGSNDISVIRAQPNGNASDRNTITVQFGATVNDTVYMMEGSFVLSNITTQIVDATPLQAPDFVFDSVTNAVTVNDLVNSADAVSKYEMGLFVEGAENPIATFTVGDPIDYTNVTNGTYYVKVKAIAVKNTIYMDSAWKDSEYTVTVVNRYTAIISGVQATAYSNPGVWYYYKDSIELEEARVDNEEKKIEVSYTATKSTNQPLKLFWNSPELEVGEEYTLSFTLVSPMAGYITVNGKDFVIVEGTNQIVVTRAQPNSSAGDRNTITIRFGSTVDGTIYTMQGSFVISNIACGKLVQTELTAPEFTFDADTLTVTIPATETDAGEVGSYQLGLFAAEATEPTATFTVVSGGTINVEDVANGTYTVKLQAISNAAEYSDSAWKDISATVTVRNGQIDLKNGGQSVANNNPETWYEYHTTSNQGMANTTITTAYYDYIEGKIYLEYSVDTSSKTTDQPVKIFYQDKSIAVGTVYTLSFTLVSPMAGYITVNEKIIAIVEGTNEISVTRALPSSGTVNVVTIQFGAKVDGTTYTMQGAFVISEIEYHEQTQTPLTAPEFTFDADTLTVTIPATETDADKVGSYKLGLFAAEATEPTATFIVVNGDTIDVKDVANGTYTVKLQAISNDINYSNSAWKDVEATIIVGNTKTNVTVKSSGAENASRDDRGVWYAYKEKITLEEAYLDNTTGELHVKYEATAEGISKPTYQPLKLFYNSPELESGTEYTLTFNFNSSMAGYIEVCGVQKEVAVGENQISITCNQPDGTKSPKVTIVIQFGSKVDGVSQMLVGEFVISEIAITPTVSE